MKPIIRSTKHYVHFPATGIASAGIGGATIVEAVARDAAINSAAKLEEGAVVKAVYLEFWVKADNPNFTVNGAYLKIPGSGTDPTYTEMQNLGSYDNKKNIFEFHQGLAPSGGNVMALFRGWYKVPKGKQRFGLGDKLKLLVTFTGSAGDLCGFSTYKEYE